MAEATQGSSGGRQANAASVAILRGREVLLIRRARPPYAGLWTLPGGRCEPDETLGDAARREIAEELGLELGGLVAVTRLRAAGPWELQVFAAAFPGGEVRPSDEIGAWRWVDAEETGQLPTTPGLGEVLRLCLRAPRPLT